MEETLLIRPILISDFLEAKSCDEIASRIRAKLLAPGITVSCRYIDSTLSPENRLEESDEMYPGGHVTLTSKVAAVFIDSPSNKFSITIIAKYRIVPITFVQLYGTRYILKTKNTEMSTMQKIIATQEVMELTPKQIIGRLKKSKKNNIKFRATRGDFRIVPVLFIHEVFFSQEKIYDKYNKNLVQFYLASSFCIASRKKETGTDIYSNVTPVIPLCLLGGDDENFQDYTPEESQIVMNNSVHFRDAIPKKILDP